MKNFFYLILLVFLLYYTCSDSNNSSVEETKVEVLSPEELQKKKNRGSVSRMGWKSYKIGTIY